MIRRISGDLERVDGNAALVAPAGGLAYEVLLPAYLAGDLAMQALPRRIELHTLELLEAQGQGSSFIPRLLGFATERDRAFFELMTTVKGMGSRKVLRAMAQTPAWIASAISRKDTKALQTLPEIGKRLAETMVAELTGKIDDYADASVIEARSVTLPAAGEEAVAALVALGETRNDAERKVSLAIERVGNADDTDALVAAAFGG